MSFTKIFTDEKFMNVITSEPQTTSEIASQVGCSHYCAEKALRGLSKSDSIKEIDKPDRGRFGFIRLWIKAGEKEK
jgi:ribosomal protein S25